MKPVISIGNQDFGSIRENGYFYVDKTDFIQEWWENGDVVTDDSRAPPVFLSSEEELDISIHSNQCQGLVRFFALRRIKPHTPPLVRAPVNSFEFQPCGRTPQAGYLLR